MNDTRAPTGPRTADTDDETTSVATKTPTPTTPETIPREAEAMAPLLQVLGLSLQSLIAVCKAHELTPIPMQSNKGPSTLAAVLARNHLFARLMYFIVLLYFGILCTFPKSVSKAFNTWFFLLVRSRFTALSGNLLKFCLKVSSRPSL